MTDRCIPAPDAEDGSWHWLRLPTGEKHPFRWVVGMWLLRGGYEKPVRLDERGWRYHSPIPSPDALAALVKAARAANNELAAAREVMFGVAEELLADNEASSDGIALTVAGTNIEGRHAALTAALAAFKEHTND